MVMSSFVNSQSRFSSPENQEQLIKPEKPAANLFMRLALLTVLVMLVTTITFFIALPVGLGAIAAVASWVLLVPLFTKFMSKADKLDESLKKIQPKAQHATGPTSDSSSSKSNAVESSPVAIATMQSAPDADCTKESIQTSSSTADAEKLVADSQECRAQLKEIGEKMVASANNPNFFTLPSSSSITPTAPLQPSEMTPKELIDIDAANSKSSLVGQLSFNKR